MEALVIEAVAVARKKGIPIEGNPIEKVKAVAEATGENRCSMGQDIDSRRKTEIDAINGAVVKEAERLGISVPYNQMITDLIKVLERGF
jgi:2-dehydropantoate 2-reductase